MSKKKLRTLEVMLRAFMPIQRQHILNKTTRGTRIAVRTEPKIGRNQTCPCGSKIKHKKCCRSK